MKGTIEREFKDFTHLPKSPWSVSSKTSRLLPSDKQVDTCVGMLASVSQPWTSHGSLRIQSPLAIQKGIQRVVASSQASSKSL